VSAAPWIPLERVLALPVAHVWDDANPFRVVRARDAAVARRTERLSRRARIGFVLACAEWVLARFVRHEASARPGHYLEALWAALADPRFVALEDEVLEDDTGPVRGPIALALLTATDAFRSEDAGDPGFASALAQHVLAGEPCFFEWQRACLARLEERAARGEEPVAREAFGIELSPDEERRLVKSFLRRLDASRNPFLVPTRH